MRNRGFTLIEMVVVLVLISLSIALVTPSLSRFSKRVELKATVQKVSGILRYFRNESIQKGRVYQILFDSGIGEIRIRALEREEKEGERKQEEEKKQEEGKKGTEEAAAQERRYPLPGGIQMKEFKIPSPEFPSDLPTIEFYPTGGSNGGAILLEMQDQKGYWIKVHFLTGIVGIEGA
jgi:prepilin-type N-terminal cleavage/methylation domain-containing protein